MKDLKILFDRNPLYDKCPECGKYGTLQRSRGRNWKEKFLRSFTFVSPYRCKSCGWRGYRSKLVLKGQSIKTLLIYGAIIVVVALTVRIILSRFMN